MTVTDQDILRIALTLTGGGLSLIVLIVGALLKRAIQGVDDKLTEALERTEGHETRLVRIETTLGIGMPRPGSPPSGTPAHRKTTP